MSVTAAIPMLESPSLKAFASLLKRSILAAAVTSAQPPESGAETPRGLLRDQALSIAAAVDVYRVCGDTARLDWARRAAEWSHAHLWDESRGAFRDAPAALSPQGGGQREVAIFTPTSVT